MKVSLVQVSGMKAKLTKSVSSRGCREWTKKKKADGFELMDAGAILLNAKFGIFKSDSIQRAFNTLLP